MKFKLKDTPKGRYYTIKEGKRYAKYKYIKGVPESAYHAKFDAKSRKSVLSFIKGNKPIQIRMTTKGGDVMKIARNGQVETFKLSPLMENEFRKALKLYLQGKIPKAAVGRATKIYTEESVSRARRQIGELTGKYRQIADLFSLLPKPSMEVKVPDWTQMNRKTIYKEIASQIKAEDISETMMKMGTRVDRRLYYTIEMRNTAGEAVFTAQLKGQRPERVAAWLAVVKQMAETGELTYEGEKIFALGGGIGGKIGEKGDPRKANKDFGGFNIGLSFKTR